MITREAHVARQLEIIDQLRESEALQGIKLRPGVPLELFVRVVADCVLNYHLSRSVRRSYRSRRVMSLIPKIKALANFSCDDDHPLADLRKEASGFLERWHLASDSEKRWRRRHPEVEALVGEKRFLSPKESLLFRLLGLYRLTIDENLYPRNEFLELNLREVFAIATGTSAPSSYALEKRINRAGGISLANRSANLLCHAYPELRCFASPRRR